MATRRRASSSRKAPGPSPDPDPVGRPPGRIVTFYSYKGGTGRSMALANVGWLLASHGKRVLMIDWDLEAPGLHRYFYPFLEDGELASTPGLIDFLGRFVEGARGGGSTEGRWFERFANFVPYTFSLEWDHFPKGAALDMMAAGQQGASYAVRISTFDWQGFYDRLGGGVFLEAVKARMRAEYDYILIDSRTGLSDTSGICTVQMPDDLVVCFTLNRQSIAGAAAVAESAASQRRGGPDKAPGLRVWPVATRVELAEKDRLEAARDAARQTFGVYLLPLTRADRESYWGRTEVPYDPFFAYEEVLATFADRPRSKLSVLDSFVNLARLLTDGEVAEAARIPDTLRQDVLARFARASRPAGPPGEVRGGYLYLSHTVGDRPLVRQLGKRIEDELGAGSVIWDEVAMLPGDPWEETLRAHRVRAVAVLAVITPDAVVRKAKDSFMIREVEASADAGQRIIPLLLGVDWPQLKENALFARLAGYHGFTFPYADRIPEDRPDEWAFFVESLRRLLREAVPPRIAVEVDPEDPQRGQFGGRSARNGRALSAEVEEVDEGWFEIRLRVERTSGEPLRGEVEFHLHPTFRTPIRRVEVEDGRAELTAWAYGAFTVGAVADGGRTRLELNLANLRSAPRAFRSR